MFNRCTISPPSSSPVSLNLVPCSTQGHSRLFLKSLPCWPGFGVCLLTSGLHAAALCHAGLPGSPVLCRQAHQLCCGPAVSEKRRSIILQAQEEFKKRKYLSALKSFQEEIEQIGVVRPCSRLLCSVAFPGWRGVISLSPIFLLLLSPWVVLDVTPKQRHRWNHRGRVQGACYRDILSAGSLHSQRIPLRKLETLTSSCREAQSLTRTGTKGAKSELSSSGSKAQPLPAASPADGEAEVSKDAAQTVWHVWGLY